MDRGPRPAYNPMPLGLLPYSVDMSPRLDEQSPSGASGSLSTPASDQHRQFSIDGSTEVHMNEGSDDSAGSEVDDNGTGNGPRAKKPRISHACQACRRMKIRCEPLDDRNSCKQCVKTNRECLITEPRRKRQKTVHRVAELEKKIEALTASLGSRDNQQERAISDPPPAYPTPDNPPPFLQRRSSIAEEIAAEIRKGAVDSDPPRRLFNRDDRDYVDVIDRGILDELTAYAAFNRWHTEMCGFFPVVVFPPATTATDIRSTRPILFLSILAGSVGVFKPSVQSVLADELTWIMAERVMYRGERSFELVQALLVLMVFYSRPKHQKELNFNQTIHIAATMALDLGMGRRSKKGIFKEESLFPGVSVVETRRTWLGCYFMCANAAMSLRHPFFIRWSPYMDESLELLSTSPDALPTDAWLCDLIRIQHISEDVAFMFSMDDPASNVSLADSKTQYHMKTFERQIDQWQKNMKSDMSKPFVRHIAANINLYVHEIAIHFDHNVDDFRPPPHMTVGEQTSDFVTPAHIDSLITCMESIHKTFDAFFEMDITTVRNLPNLFFVRNAYAAVALIKMDGVLHSKGSKFGSIFAPDLRVESYLDTMIEVQARAGEGGKCSVATAFGFVFTKLKTWYQKKRGDIPDSGTNTMMSSQAQNSCQQIMNIVESEHDGPEQVARHAARSGPPMLSEIPNQKFSDVSRGITMQPAASGPTTVIGEADQNWAADVLGFPMGQGFPVGGISDTTMFNLGLPQFYDFGFTFDDMGLSTNTAGGEDSGWMGFGI